MHPQSAGAFFYLVFETVILLLSDDQRCMEKNYLKYKKKGEKQRFLQSNE